LGLLAMAMVRRPEAALLAELALIGVGLGAFTPANNAAIMGSATLNQTGLVGGILNMTRGSGTALGVALTGLLFTLFSRSALSNQHPAGASELVAGFQAALIFLACVAGVAAVLAALRGRARAASASHA
ncbi:MAG: hypothetical protein ACRDFX_11180, partial [Chloroflexota bacterium]